MPKAPINGIEFYYETHASAPCQRDSFLAEITWLFGMSERGDGYQPASTNLISCNNGPSTRLL